VTKEYIQKIDFFRALSILLVVLFHLDLKPFQGGFIGVDVFFVISGFLITRIIKQELDQTGSFNFGEFYLRRARRLLPSLFLMFFLVFVFTYFLFSPSDFIKSTQSILMAAIVISNIFFFRQSGYFDKSSELEPLLHTWSLGIEEQFYLLWPLTLVLICKLFKGRYFTLTTILFVVSLAMTYLISAFPGKFFMGSFEGLDTDQIKSAIFYLLPFRIFEFLIGAIAFFYVNQKQRIEKGALALNLLGVGLIIMSAMFLNKQIALLGVLNIIPCLGIALLLVVDFPSLLKPIYHNKFLGFVGKASYTWYLFHWPMIALSKYALERSLTTAESLAIFFSSLFLSLVIYKFYENPIRYGSGALDFQKDKVFIISVLASVLTSGFLSYHVTNNDGWLFRLSKEQNRIAAQYDTLEDFHKNYWGGAGYEIGIIGESPSSVKKIDLVLLGESHCGHFVHGLDSLLVKKHKKTVYVSNLMNPSAIYLPDIIPTHLDPTIISKSLEKTINVLKQNSEATLLISHYWSVQMRRSKVKLSNGQLVPLPTNTQGFKIIADKIEKLLEIVGPRKVILFGSGPIMPYTNKLNHIERLLKPNYIEGEKSTPTTFKPHPSYYQINEFFSKYAESKQDVFYFDPREPFCESGVCVAQKDEVVYLSDWDHLSKDGSFRLVKYFEKRILGVMNGGH